MHLTDPNTKRNFARYCREVLGIDTKQCMATEFEAFTAHCTDEIDIQTKTINLLLHEEPDWRGYFAWNKANPPDVVISNIETTQSALTCKTPQR